MMSKKTPNYSKKSARCYNGDCSIADSSEISSKTRNSERTTAYKSYRGSDYWWQQTTTDRPTCSVTSVENQNHERLGCAKKNRGNDKTTVQHGTLDKQKGNWWHHATTDVSTLSVASMEDQKCEQLDCTNKMYGKKGEVLETDVQHELDKLIIDNQNWWRRATPDVPSFLFLSVEDRKREQVDYTNKIYGNKGEVQKTNMQHGILDNRITEKQDVVPSGYSHLEDINSALHDPLIGQGYSAVTFSNDNVKNNVLPIAIKKDKIGSEKREISSKDNLITDKQDVASNNSRIKYTKDLNVTPPKPLVGYAYVAGKFLNNNRDDNAASKAIEKDKIRSKRSDVSMTTMQHDAMDNLITGKRDVASSDPKSKYMKDFNLTPPKPLVGYAYVVGKSSNNNGEDNAISKDIKKVKIHSKRTEHDYLTTGKGYVVSINRHSHKKNEIRDNKGKFATTIVQHGRLDNFTTGKRHTVPSGRGRYPHLEKIHPALPDLIRFHGFDGLMSSDNRGGENAIAQAIKQGLTGGNDAKCTTSELAQALASSPISDEIFGLCSLYPGSNRKRMPYTKNFKYD